VTPSSSQVAAGSASDRHPERSGLRPQAAEAKDASRSQTVTSRARVLAALRHEETGRVPIDLGGMRSSGINAVAYRRLTEHLALPSEPPLMYDIMQQLSQPHAAVLDRFAADALPLHRAPIGFDLARPAWKPSPLYPPPAPLIPAALDYLPRADGGREIRNPAGCVLYRMPATGLYFEPVYEPLANAETVADIEAWAPPRISDAELAWVVGEAKALRASTDRAILGLTGVRLYEGAQNARGWQRFMEDLASRPHLAEALLQRLADAACADLARYLDAVGPYIDIIQLGDDLGTQAGPQLSPRMYRRLVKPRHAQVWQFAKQRSGLPLFLHCCGGIYPLIPDLIDAGVDILNPVQISAVGMDPARLKREFGRDLVFWGGGCDTQRILPDGTPAEVRDHVRRQIDILAPGGGFVFTQVHNILANVPPENIVAMFDAALEFGGYDTIRARRAGIRDAEAIA
jgi:uroporphyrinogen decarboxylase